MMSDGVHEGVCDDDNNNPRVTLQLKNTFKNLKNTTDLVNIFEISKI